MNQFEYDIAIQANTQNEADTKMEALMTIAARLTSNELAKMADVIKNDPFKTALAKKYLGV
jgi:hypothetical protein